jgi:hypothetical protein
VTEREARWVLIDKGENGEKLRYGVLDRAEVWGTLWVAKKQIAVRTINQRLKKYPWPDEEETA